MLYTRVMSLIIGLILVTACGCVLVQFRRGHPISPEITHLEGLQHSVAVGDVMTSSAPLFIHEYITLKEKLQADTAHKSKMFHITAETGSYELVAKDAEGKFFESLGAPVIVDGRKTVGGLFVPHGITVPPALYWHWDRSLRAWDNGIVYIAPIGHLPELKTTRVKSPPNNFSGFVSTLTYAGIAGGQIKFVYREYKDGLARAAFTQEVSLDYNPETTYAYQSCRFIVHAADIISVSYTLLSPL